MMPRWITEHSKHPDQSSGALTNQCKLVDCPEKNGWRVRVDVRIHNVDWQWGRFAIISVSAIPLAFFIKAAMRQAFFLWRSLAKSPKPDGRRALAFSANQAAATERADR